MKSIRGSLIIVLFVGGCATAPYPSVHRPQDLRSHLTGDPSDLSLLQRYGSEGDLIWVETENNQRGYVFEEDLLQMARVREAIKTPLTIRKEPVQEIPEEGEEPRYDVPIVINERVEHFVEFFLTDHREYFAKWLARSTRYLPMMRKIFREQGLPEDLVYLAMVESGFSPRAYSRAKAMGIWQFIAPTGRRYGLEINSWVDERRDPVKATYAASQYLKDLHEMFGSWYLAAAAYNAGEGKVSRAIARHDTDDFWKLAEYRYLRRETKDYVPKFIAATLIAKNPEKYGFVGVPYEEPLQYDEVSVEGSYDLQVIAQAAGTTSEMVTFLNPELRRNATPPYSKEYPIKLPPGTGELALLRLASIPPQERNLYVEHRVRRGETLGAIAARYGVRTSDVVHLNRLSSANKIYVGQELRIPTGSQTPIVMEAKYSPEPKTSVIRHRVRRGESLWSVAKLYGVSVTELKRWNDLGRGSVVYAGQRLKIYTSGKSPLAENQDFVFHEVRNGENLTRIANRYGVTISQIQQWNGMGRRTKIYPGTQLKIFTSDPI
ncbi:MAG: LysM peptidoglycan-binding domain-containing protein [Deltaproteobacteria bacterium]|nr:LysM peptidoglycan-binding domain-containing protein [Deltaproteobacteria bacterium]